VSVLARGVQYFSISFLTLEDKWYNPELRFISNKIIYGQLSTKAWQCKANELANYTGKTTFFY